MLHFFLAAPLARRFAVARVLRSVLRVLAIRCLSRTPQSPRTDPVAAADQRTLRDQSSPAHLLRGMLAARMALDRRVALCVAEPARSGLWKPRALGEMRAAGLQGIQVPPDAVR